MILKDKNVLNTLITYKVYFSMLIPEKDKVQIMPSSHYIDAVYFFLPP